MEIMGNSGKLMENLGKYMETKGTSLYSKTHLTARKEEKREFGVSRDPRLLLPLIVKAADSEELLARL
jgi:hypothetical protein